MSLIFDSAMLPFTAALLLMVVLGAIEALGLGAGANFDVDDGGVLDWLGVGQVPFLVLLVVALSLFGIAGWIIQQSASALAGGMLPLILAVPAALAVTVPVTAIAIRGLARILPRDETTAFARDHLIGLTGTIVTGEARSKSPARARVEDPHGQPHFVMVEPDVTGTTFQEGDEVLLVRRDGEHFRAIFHASPRLSNWTVP